MAEVVINPATNDIAVYVNEGIPGTVLADNTVTLTNKTISYDDNTLPGVQPSLDSGVNIKTINGEDITGPGDIAVLGTNVNGADITNIGTITFESQGAIASTSGSINIDWSANQNYQQAQPIGGITYTFTDPLGPCHLQLIVASSGTSTAQAFVWPANVKWQTFVWEALDDKSAVINFWFDGADYWAMGSNSV